MIDPLNWLVALIIYMIVAFAVAWVLKLTVRSEHDCDVHPGNSTFPPPEPA